MIKAIIFDCFGVIITDALQGIVDELRTKDAQAADEVRDLVRLSNRGMLPAEEYGARVSELLGTNIEGYRQMLRDAEVKNTELLKYIEVLKPGYKTALLSNIGKQGLARRFSTQELADHFDVVVASAEIGFAKPEAEAYEITAEKLGVRLDECAFIDDREEFCDGARAVGMQAILYKDFKQFHRELEELLQTSSS